MREVVDPDLVVKLVTDEPLRRGVFFTVGVCFVLFRVDIVADDVIGVVLLTAFSKDDGVCGVGVRMVRDDGCLLDIGVTGVTEVFGRAFMCCVGVTDVVDGVVGGLDGVDLVDVTGVVGAMGVVGLVHVIGVVGAIGVGDLDVLDGVASFGFDVMDEGVGDVMDEGVGDGMDEGVGVVVSVHLGVTGVAGVDIGVDVCLDVRGVMGVGGLDDGVVGVVGV